MPLSLHAAFVPSCRQIIGGCLNVLTKAEAAGITDLGEARLAPDMYPLAFQVKQVAMHSKGAIEAVRKGVFTPGGDPLSADYATFKAALQDADAALASVTEAEMEGFIGGTTLFAFGERKMPFKSEDFLLSFSQPNFYFHATMVYAIFRNQGLALGKMDYMGRPRLAM
ncbi:DUF1993 family protein [Sandarakinorhabdus oryzae]|uniref:DUF1993 family protein n=1 Tax=Sandarakinorhabdus oryzae TaxID=2675220 RepID=UPI0012E11255|nr:DUF1993 family protein [Sandarakinorhabdus oryzae]